MLSRRIVVSTLVVDFFVLGMGIVLGQDYPSKPIRIVTGGAGGASDIASRLIAQGISGAMGQPLFVDNRATSFIPGELVSKAPPDGYTVVARNN